LNIGNPTKQSSGHLTAAANFVIELKGGKFMKQILGRLLKTGASNISSALEKTSNEEKCVTHILSCLKVIQSSHYLVAVAISSLMLFSPVDLTAQQPKKIKTKAATIENKKIEEPKDSRLNDPSWDSGFSPNGCYWTCTSPNGCAMVGQEGGVFTEKTKLLVAAPGTLIEANGWLRQCDKESPSGNNEASATDKDHH
jgi:hypothetical protein